MKKNSVAIDILVMVIISLVLSSLLGFVYDKTKTRISEIQIEKNQKAYKTVVSDFDSIVNISDSIKIPKDDYAFISNESNFLFLVKNKQKESIGYIVETYSKGYNDNIKLIVGFDINGSVTGISFSSKPQETPGIGLKILENSFVERFIDKNYSNINDVDGITSATYSSNGFKRAISYAAKIVDLASGKRGQNEIKK